MSPVCQVTRPDIHYKLTQTQRGTTQPSRLYPCLDESVLQQEYAARKQERKKEGKKERKKERKEKTT
eukprot:1146143-Pelagomonas_calceolata.AAC.1